MVKAEHELAKRIWSMRRAGQFTDEREAELKAMQAEADKHAHNVFVDTLMVGIRNLGRLPNMIKNLAGGAAGGRKKRSPINCCLPGETTI